MSATRVLQVARDEVGYLEKKSNSQIYDKGSNAGYNNYTKYGAWYAGGSLQGEPWCDMFVSWCAANAGEGTAVGCYAYVPSHIQFFKNKGQYFARGAKTPQCGDIIFFRDESHVGIVEKVSGGYVYTIEGNTNGGSTLVPNGGGVHQKTYPLTSSYILGYGRPAYSAEYNPGWNKNAAGWWYVRQDGSYPKSAWEQVDGKWYYFNEEGYMQRNVWITSTGNPHYVGDDGMMVTNRSVRIDENGHLVPAGAHYYKLGEVPPMYREVLDKLIADGKLKGREGTGEDLVLDMSEEMVRALVIMNR